MKRTKKKKIETSKIVLIILAVFLLIFTITMIVVFCVKDAVPDSLIVAIFGICGGEAGVLGWIKTTKEKKIDRLYELQDRLWGNNNGNDYQ